ncbi:isopenicillin-N N-acyltransferase-like protein [Spinactinospora alkalitolerans]|uniref:Isopenicillin-N N-acyltransferase-like protein n=1 Tax=Spinactinospora alkalitolerans TaxID=687207 RepID=A0A852TYM6_9ACTN|nr:C45 family peptidase [Spinactinospora alkalitolerans]NYE48102.1 isopenicillin-N N-acyltransferase-like protein [Spinactinospora alkalitolerans]
MPQILELHRFRGSHRSIGRQHGTACADLVAEHLDLALARLASAGVDRATATAVAAEYRPFVQEYAGHLDEEIAGIAEGAGITLAEAYLLQLRAEVYADVLGSPATANECTTFAALPEATATGTGLAGQNADLPDLYAGLMIVVHIEPDDGPEILMATPAGQVSYIGISSTGMAVFANFLNCEGWRRGFPRYLLSRFAMHHAGVAQACSALRDLPRASSRNLVLLDAAGTAVDFENTPRRSALLPPEDALLAHSNHYLAPDLLDEERSNARYLRNSRIRHARMRHLLKENHGRLDPPTMAAILRDRDDGADGLSVHAEDHRERGDEDHYMTVASVIAEPARGRIWVSAGPPSRSRYVEYSFAGGRGIGHAF